MARPRSISLSPEEMIALGEEMMNWLKENEHYVLHLSDWYTLHKGFTYNEWKSFIVKDEFYPYYEKALKFVGRKCLDKESKLREATAQRFLRVYYKDVKEEEDAAIKFKSDLDKEVAKVIPSDIKEGQLALMNQLKAMQAEKENPVKDG